MIGVGWDRHGSSRLVKRVARCGRALAGRAWARSAADNWSSGELGTQIGSSAAHRELVLPGQIHTRGIPQTGYPGLGAVALDDGSGDGPADAYQQAPYAVLPIVVHRSSSVSGHLFAGHLHSRQAICRACDAPALAISDMRRAAAVASPVRARFTWRRRMARSGQALDEPDARPRPRQITDRARLRPARCARPRPRPPRARRD